MCSFIDMLRQLKLLPALSIWVHVRTRSQKRHCSIKSYELHCKNITCSPHNWMQFAEPCICVYLQQGGTVGRLSDSGLWLLPWNNKIGVFSHVYLSKSTKDVTKTPSMLLEVGKKGNIPTTVLSLSRSLSKWEK